MADHPYRLYGMPGSLYTAKVRAALRKSGLAFREHAVGEPRFLETIVPKIQRWIIPVVETPDGEIWQDGSAILDALTPLMPEDQTPTPEGPVQRVIAHLFELFGGEGLLRPAMHYRWNFDAENLAFLTDDFTNALVPGGDADAKAAFFARSSGRMRQAAAGFGVSPETGTAIEAAYKDFLDRFSAHLHQMPFLLGHRPSIGDYALLGPLYAHMGRDPAPLRLMQTRAPEVFRWCERMNAPDTGTPGHGPEAPAFLPGDEIPDSLAPLLAFIAEDYLPELTAHVAFANDWLAANPDIEPGTNGLKRPGDRSLGMAAFSWRGHDIQTLVMPYRFWLLQRLQDAADALDGDAQTRLGDILSNAGLSDLLTLRTTRRVDRQNHVEVWT